MNTLIIAEIGNNHNGSLELGKRLIDSVVESGANIAKFQLRSLNDLYRERDVEDLGVEYTKDIIYKYNLDATMHHELAEYCRQVGIEYMCTPWDIQSVEHLEQIGVKRYKIASADFDNLPLLETIVKTKKPLYLSTGMSTISDIVGISDFLKKKRAEFTLLHCNSTYPAPFVDIQLNFIKKLKQIHSSVGYSGHERGLAVTLAAVALGATVIERHITLDKGMEGPDHQASLLPKEFKALVQMIEEVEQALGDSETIERKLSQGAILNKENLGKSLIAARDLPAGTVVDRGHVEIRSPGQGLSPKQLNDILGKTLSVDLKRHDFIYLDHFKSKMKANDFSQLGANWGIPVRPHDVMALHERFYAPIYEFHVSYMDLRRTYLDPRLVELKGHEFIMHAPELFDDSLLLDLCSDDKDIRARSIENMYDVKNFCKMILDHLRTSQKFKIVANVGGFSIHEFRKVTERPLLYDRISEALNHLNDDICEIIPQNMAPFPWHFGGQRYQNIFMQPEEIVQFCSVTSTKICLDTAHLSMFCNYAQRNFNECFDLLMPFTSHLHLSDAKGLNGEGVILGSGDIDFEYVLTQISPHQTYIVETWQGHKNNGAGFVQELNYLKGLTNRR
jgi:N-acetylneuraminate synthase